MRRIFLLCCTLACVLLGALTVNAEEISGSAALKKHTGFSSDNRLFDGRTMESTKIRNGGTVTLSCDAGIGSVYLVFGEEYGAFSVTDEGSGETRTVGQTGYLHEFLDLEAVFGTAPETVTLTFSNGDVKLAELSVFTPGEVPDWVQRWQSCAEGEADLVLFSTHGDDEQLFFAGMLPYYAAERGYNVQVVYMTDHRNMTMRRSHEMLDGLWAVGVRHYPVFGTFGDYNTQSLAEAYQKYRNKGISREDILSFVVENVRRFRPKVAVGHDLRGEYGHGMHMVYAELLCEAVTISADAEQFPESAERYGIWDVPKTYLHLYPENRINMDWDIPLESFGGMTAFEVTKHLGFPCHVSQQTYYSWYFQGMDAASEITQYSPCAFGLYRTTVGQDVQKNDFFEHMTTHAQDAELEARWQAEEEARLEAERLAAQETAETLQTQETQPAPAQSSAPVAEEEPEAAEPDFRLTVGIAGGMMVFFLVFGLIGVVKKENKKF